MAAVRANHEQNPMLGLRGVRLGLKIRGLFTLQIRAIAEAYVECKNKGLDPRPEIMVPLIGSDRELQIVRDYLKLQKYRYGDIFNDEYEVDESLLNIRIPKLILQPLVENALYHGVRPKGEKCIIRITIYEKDGDLHIIVYDSGVGMSPEKIQQMRQREDSDGFGFTGTIDRIRYFSDRDDVFSIRSVEGEYTEVELVIPITIKEKE